MTNASEKIITFKSNKPIFTICYLQGKSTKCRRLDQTITSSKHEGGMDMKLSHRIMRGAALLSILGSIATAQAKAEPAEYQLKAAYESLSLPGSETMGILGLGVERTLNDYFSVGAGTWMAMRGERGGFITIGLQGSGHVPLSGSIELEAGAFVGAGGGRGGYELSGGGLMLRGYVGLANDFGAWGRLGGGISYVDFPNGGAIDSVQPVVFYSLPFSFDNPDIAGLNFEESSLAVVSRFMNVSSGVRKGSGVSQDDFTLLGVVWKGYIDETWFVRAEMEGAAGGNSTGFMQILLGGGARLPISERLSLDASLSVGGGGGGDVDSGGGFLVDVSGGVQYALNDDFFAGAGLSWLTAPNGSLKGFSPSVSVGAMFGQESPREAEALPIRFRVVSQHYFKGSDDWRAHHADKDVDNLGVQLDYFVLPGAYLTGQALAAFSGDAGAYMTGLLGAGVHQEISGPLFAELEGLVGAAGGGGLDVGSGLVWQTNASLGYQISEDVAFMVTGGYIDAFKRKFDANVLGLSLVFGWQ